MTDQVSSPQSVQFTLVQAAKLRNRVQARLSELQKLIRTGLRVHVVVNDTLSTSIEVVNAAQEKVWGDITEFTVLSNACYNIRLRLSLANTEVGITDLLTRLNQLKVQQSTFRALADIDRYQLTTDDLTSRVEGQRANNASSHYGKDVLEVPTLSLENVNHLRNALYAINTELDSIQSELDRLNATKQIDLDVSLVDSLKLYKII